MVAYPHSLPDVQPDIGETPLATLMESESMVPALAAREWVIDATRRQGRSHALLLTAGKGVATLRHGQVALRAPCLAWLPPGMAQSIRLEAGSAGYMLSAAEELVSRASAASQHAAALRNVADRLLHIGPDEMAAGRDMLRPVFEAVSHELRQAAKGAAGIAVAYLSIVLTHLWRMSDIDPEAPTGERPGSVVFQRFLRVVEMHFREHWPISRYARTLGVTERRLHAASMRSAGCGPLAVVHERLLQEARVRLQQSPLPVAQVAYGLGFRDTAHFNRFFKRHMGVPPGSYRRRVLEEAGREDLTYSAWP